ncbi:minor extracellular serine protease Vpr [Lentibacillus persicus]|uniref:Minor extracellular serine protease Vpr n=1 Tax=Lentibacillus persicus TaxID=640948 RepID=A0A1I1XR70_9BACI|nr:S8 family serine peptidase [Lentibacillus persicus]SFE09731.1 minor extracellular serine protease Vpr [Lentibacillus persicus]
MRRILLVLSAAVIFLFTAGSATAEKDLNEKTSIIIEVDGSPKEHKTYLETYHPYIDVIAVYDTLFNGLALKGEPERFKRLESLDFIKSVHPAVSYKIEQEQVPPLNQTENSVMPSDLNKTSYTGEGVQVAVIDTGIDYNHPDLKDNYAGGYDLVDLDEDPMETTVEEGIPTMHGTHVAGIIAANGQLKGVAPDAAIYAYRALGPGGMGTSVQVIAALEEAIDDGADIINLSLGNAVNGPDFPTSAAVNRAVDLGVPVVIANGNAGPENWTIGSPATATNALSVGASSNPRTVPFLFESLSDKKIPLVEMRGSKPWQLDKSYDVASLDGQNVKGKIALIQRGKTPFTELARQAQKAGATAALIYNHEKGNFQGTITDGEVPVRIPVASISKKDGEWLSKKAKNNYLYMETKFATTKLGIADFSSRGPVTVNWDLKPDVSAPGTRILSTVPEAYGELQGTSMAAPQVSGAMALLMEAHPDWTVEELTGALKTTAERVNDAGSPIAPNIQGTGTIRPEEAINTKTVIEDPLLSFGKITDHQETKTAEIVIENKSEEAKAYTFSVPKKQKGLTWKLPLSFTLEGGQTKKLAIELTVNQKQIDEGIQQGWLTLNEGDKPYHLPYLFVNRTAAYPKAMGFDFSLEAFSNDTYSYQLYLPDPAESIEVALYHPQTLMYEQTLIESENVQVGLNEGKIKASKIDSPGEHVAVISVRLTDGSIESYQTRVYIDET